MRTMTKTLRTTLIALTAALVILMIVTGIVLLSSLQSGNNDLYQLYVRRQDLMIQQQRLLVTMEGLNTTLQMEIGQNQQLQDQLTQASLAAQQLATQQPTPKPAAPPPAPVVVQPTPQPVRIVTRES